MRGEGSGCSSAKVGGGWRAGVQVERIGSIEGLIGRGGSGVGALCSLGAETRISSGLGQSADVALS